MATVDQVFSELRQVFDPEIPVNIVDLGLIYDVQVEGSAARVKMTLTSQACPEARTIPEVAKRRITAIEGIESCDIEIVWEPTWTPQLITPNGRRILGLPEEEPAH